MSHLTAFAADWEDRMLTSCLSEDVPAAGMIKNAPCNKKATNKKIPYISNEKLNNNDDGMLEDEVEIISDAINQTSLTQSSSDCSYSSYEEDHDEEDDDECHSTGSEDSDISLCRTRQFGQELDLNRHKTIIQSGNVEITVDSGECVTTSIADFFFGVEGTCYPHVDDDEYENARRLRKMRSRSSTSAATAATAAQPTTITSKRSSLKQVATILDKCALNRRKRNVGFDQVNIREYKLSISHNPSCSEGPPIELGWEFQEATSVSVDLYEECRGPKRRLPELVLSENTRRRMLLNAGGYSKQDLKEAIREVEHLKRQRILTYMMLPARALDEAAEEMFSAITSVFKE